MLHKRFNMFTQSNRVCVSKRMIKQGETTVRCSLCLLAMCDIMKYHGIYTVIILLGKCL